MRREPESGPCGAACGAHPEPLVSDVRPDLARALLRPANLLSLSRVVMAALVFPLRSSLVALGVLAALAALSDVLDGWVARHSGGSAELGAWLDPVCDKVFVLALLGVLAWDAAPPLWVVALTLARELLVVPAGVYVALFRRGARFEWTARPSGKATTVLQFATMLAIALRLETASMLGAVLCAIAGAIAAYEYAQRLREPSA